MFVCHKHRHRINLYEKTKLIHSHEIGYSLLACPLTGQRVNIPYSRDEMQQVFIHALIIMIFAVIHCTSTNQILRANHLVIQTVPLQLLSVLFANGKCKTEETLV